MQLERAPERGSFKNAAKMQHKMQQKCSTNVMQLERAPNRVPSNLAAKMQQKCSANVMQLERAPNRNPMREFLGLN
jgi:hypothetical protein